MSYLNINEIKDRFSYYAKQVMKGKKFTICFRNKPFAELIPLPDVNFSVIKFGVLKDQFTVPEDFNAELKDFEKDYYGS